MSERVASDSTDLDVPSLLDPDALKAAVAAAERAFAEASDLAELAAVRPAHLGDRAPVLLARRELGALARGARSDAGKGVDAARVAVTDAYAAGLAGRQAERDQRDRAEARADGSLPWAPSPGAARR